MIIPFLPLGSFSLRVDLNLEEAIAKRGQYMKLKRGSHNGLENVSFKYHPASGMGRGGLSYGTYSWLVTYIRYQCEIDNLRIKVVVIPNAFIVLFLTFWLSGWTFMVAVFPPDMLPVIFRLIPTLVGLGFGFFVWREIVGIKESIIYLFRDHLIDPRRERVRQL
jgi:hypothetical protein